MSGRSYSAPSVVKAFSVLKVLAESGEPLSLKEISEKTGINKSSCLGILKALESVGVVRKDEATKKYERTLHLLEYVSGLDSSHVLLEASKGILEKVSENCSDTIFLGKLENGFVRILRVIEGKGDFVLTSSPGVRIPADAGAIGKAINSGERGYFVDRGGEYIPGVGAVCSPIFFGKKIFGFIWIAGYGIPEGEFDKYGKMLVSASKEIEKRLKVGEKNEV